jgi:hypothetical protein
MDRSAAKALRQPKTIPVVLVVCHCQHPEATYQSMEILTAALPRLVAEAYLQAL